MMMTMIFMPKGLVPTLAACFVSRERSSAANGREP